MSVKSVNINEEGFQRRLDVVQKILDQYGLKSSSVTPLAYVDHCPFPFNNFLYKVDLAEPARPSHFQAVSQACTSLPPAEEGVSTVVVRLSNPQAEGLNNANRVENDVAAQHLARQSLAAKGLAASIVPAAYAWAPCRFVPGVAEDESTFGWSLCECKAGEDLDAHVPTLSLDAFRAVSEQLAPVLAALQGAAIPARASHFGGLTLADKDGASSAGTTPVSSQAVLESGPMVLLPDGPFATYADVWKSKLALQLNDAAQSALLQGWTPGGLCARLASFLSSGGVERVLEGVDIHHKVLVHGDLTTNNMLYDPTTNTITGLIDFDWASISHPVEEFLSGLGDIGGGIRERVGPLQPLILSGNFGTAPPQPEEGQTSEAIQRTWEMAKIWDDALRRAGAIRPSDIAGVEKVQALQELEGLLCPFPLAQPMMLKRLSDEQKAKKRADTEAKIVQWLDRYEGKTD